MHIQEMNIKTSKVLHIFSILSIFVIGLHLPRAFVLLYVFIALTSAESVLRISRDPIVLRGPRFNLFISSLFLIFVYSCLYTLGMIQWGYWTFSESSRDIVNATLIPTSIFAAGASSACNGRSRNSQYLLSYAMGGLVYVIASILVSRHILWDMSEVFQSSIFVPWGNPPSLNVRSVDQCILPAMALLPTSITVLLTNHSKHAKLTASIFLLLGLIGVYCEFSLNGRIGFFALVLAMVPPLILMAHKFTGQRFSFRLTTLACVPVAICALALFQKLMSSMASSGTWSRGLCDERLSLYWSFVTRLSNAPWGGRILRVPFSLCDGQHGLLASSRGSVQMAHNVLLDTYYSVGFPATIALLLPTVIILVFVIKYLISSIPVWNWHLALRFGWLAVCFTEWFFQPLIYSDRLLFFFSFFILGLLYAESCPVRDSRIS